MRGQSEKLFHYFDSKIVISVLTALVIFAIGIFVLNIIKPMIIKTADNTAKRINQIENSVEESSRNISKSLKRGETAIYETISGSAFEKKIRDDFDKIITDRYMKDEMPVDKVKIHWISKEMPDFNGSAYQEKKWNDTLAPKRTVKALVTFKNNSFPPNEYEYVIIYNKGKIELHKSYEWF